MSKYLIISEPESLEFIYKSYLSDLNTISILDYLRHQINNEFQEKGIQLEIRLIKSNPHFSQYPTFCIMFDDSSPYDNHTMEKLLNERCEKNLTNLSLGEYLKYITDNSERILRLQESYNSRESGGFDIVI